MNHQELLYLLFKGLDRGLSVVEPRIIGDTLEIDVDGATYIIRVSRKNSK